MIDLFDLDLGDERQVVRHAIETARAGGDKSTCPVGPADPMWSPWQQSWARTKSGIEQASGAMALRTQQMKAEVRRQTEHLHYVQPDPCAEVLPDRKNPDGVVSSAMVAAGIGALQVHIQVVADEFTAAMERMTAMFENYNLSSMLADLHGIADAVEAPTKARLRHGSAASCPRHGETRGGTCMKCARSRR